jgi:hypothetical protein
MPIVPKCGSLGPLEPYGPVKACNGIALPLPYFFMAAGFGCNHKLQLFRHSVGTSTLQSVQTDMLCGWRLSKRIDWNLYDILIYLHGFSKQISHGNICPSISLFILPPNRSH